MTTYGNLDPNDPIATAQALAAHNGQPAYVRSVASEKARAAGGNKFGAAQTARDNYAAANMLTVRFVDVGVGNEAAQDAVDGMEGG